MAITNKNLAEAIKNILGSSTENVPTSRLGPFTEEDLIASIFDGDYFTFVNIINAIVADDRVSECITIDVSEAILNSENSSYLRYLETMNLSSSIRCHSVEWCMGNCPLQTFKEYLRIYENGEINYNVLSVACQRDGEVSKYVQKMYNEKNSTSRVADMKKAILKDNIEIFSHNVENLSSIELSLACIEDCKYWDQIIRFLTRKNRPNMLDFILPKVNISIFTMSATRRTCLIDSIENEFYECVQVLLRHFPPTDSEKISSDVVPRLFKKAIATGELRYVEALVDAGFSVTVGVCACDTPLFQAAAGHHDDMVKYFIKKGVDINSFDSYGDHYQCGRGQFYKMIGTGNVEGFKILRNNGGDWTVTTGKVSVFMTAVSGQKMEFIHSMVTGGYPLNDEIRGKALLEFIIISENMGSLANVDVSETINMLIEEGVNMDSRGHENCTALHYACDFQNHDLVRTLLIAGADPLAVNINMKTPLEYINDASFREEMKNFAVIPTPPDLPDLPVFKGYTPEVEESEDMKTLRRLTRDLQDLKGLAAALRCQLENLRAMR